MTHLFTDLGTYISWSQAAWTVCGAVLAAVLVLCRKHRKMQDEPRLLVTALEKKNPFSFFESGDRVWGMRIGVEGPQMHFESQNTVTTK